MTDREKDIQTLCYKILNMHYPTDRQSDEYCPFCMKEISGEEGEESKPFNHEPDCVVLIAKDLSTNHEPICTKCSNMGWIDHPQGGRETCHCHY